PRFPEHQQRKGEHDEKKQALGIHGDFREPGRGRRGATDDSGRAASARASRRAPCRAARALRARTRSTTDGSGSAFPAWGSPNSGNQRRGRTAACSPGSNETLFYFRQRGLGCSDADQDVAAAKARLMRPEQFPQPALHPVAIDRARKNALGNDQTEPRYAERMGPEGHAESGTSERRTAGEQRNDIGSPETQPSTVAPADAQTPSRARPFARRARITARPPRVRMRTRNPWVRFLRTTEG